MKRIFSILLFLLVAVMFATADTYEVTAKSLNVRKAPNASAKVLFTVKKGYYLNVIELQGQWAYIDMYDGKGWVSTNHIKKVECTPTKNNDLQENIFQKPVPTGFDKIVSIVAYPTDYFLYEDLEEWIKLIILLVFIICSVSLLLYNQHLLAKYCIKGEKNLPAIIRGWLQFSSPMAMLSLARNETLAKGKSSTRQKWQLVMWLIIIAVLCLNIYFLAMYFVQHCVNYKDINILRTPLRFWNWALLFGFSAWICMSIVESLRLYYCRVHDSIFAEEGIIKEGRFLTILCENRQPIFRESFWKSFFTLLNDAIFLGCTFVIVYQAIYGAGLMDFTLLLSVLPDMLSHAIFGESSVWIYFFLTAITVGLFALILILIPTYWQACSNWTYHLVAFVYGLYFVWASWIMVFHVFFAFKFWAAVFMCVGVVAIVMLYISMGVTRDRCPNCHRMGERSTMNREEGEIYTEKKHTSERRPTQVEEGWNEYTEIDKTDHYVEVSVYQKIHYEYMCNMCCFDYTGIEHKLLARKKYKTGTSISKTRTSF